MIYFDDYIVKRVPKEVRKRTKENMEVYFMDLYDAFDEAARKFAKKGTELWKAWYYCDLRKYIPSAYNEEYLDFNAYPMKY